MLKGLALTPPVIGRISIGRVIERAGKRLPEKDDEFTITSQVQTREGWVNHPLDAILRTDEVKLDVQGHPKAGLMAEGKSKVAKLRSIPVRLLFDDPDLNLRANYSLFDRQTGRPRCVGNGETCKRSTSTGIQTLPCLSPEACVIGMEGNCKPYGRMNVRIGDDDELGSFVFRTTGFNSIRTLSTRLKYFAAVCGGRLSTLPLSLRLRGKSTTQSHRAPIYYVDLTVRAGMTLTEAVSMARDEWETRQVAGFDQGALDEAAKVGFAAGAFEESAEEGVAVVEEFFPDPRVDDLHANASVKAVANANTKANAAVNASSIASAPAHRAGSSDTGLANAVGNRGKSHKPSLASRLERQAASLTAVRPAAMDGSLPVSAVAVQTDQSGITHRDSPP